MMINLSFGLQCGDNEFNPNIEICCPQFFDVPVDHFNVFSKKNAFLDCCGADVAFDTRTQICCGDGQVMAKDENSQQTGCCGNIAFDTQKFHCCLESRGDNARGQLFDPSTQICCSADGEDKGQNVQIHRDKYRTRLANQYSGYVYYGKVHSGSKCCGPSRMPMESKNLLDDGSNQYICCTNLDTGVKSVERGNDCCNGVGYFQSATKEGKICCRNDRFEEIFGQGDSCCGLQAFYKSTHRCCKDQLARWIYGPDVSNECCHNTPYNPSYDLACCVEAIYEKQTQFCCKGKVHVRLPNVTNVEDLTCCNGRARQRSAGICCSSRSTESGEDWFESMIDCNFVRLF